MSEQTSKQTFKRIPNESTEDLDTAPCDRKAGTGPPIADSLSAEIGRVATDEDFTARATRLLQRDRELIERLAR